MRMNVSTWVQKFAQIVTLIKAIAKIVPAIAAPTPYATTSRELIGLMKYFGELPVITSILICGYLFEGRINHSILPSERAISANDRDDKLDKTRSYSRGHE
jgi:hypothetical protein